MAWAADVPTLKVEIAFASDALTASPTWTDVSADVRNVRTRYGRSDETQQMQPASATIVLDNRTRKYDPTNAASPYVGWLQPMKQVRVIATWSAGDYYLFWGHAKSWPQRRDKSNRDAVVELECVDLMTHVSDIQLPNLSAVLTRFGQPTWWYPLNDDETGEFARVALEKTRDDHGVYAFDGITSFVDFQQEALIGETSSVALSGGASIILSAGTRPFLLDPVVTNTTYTMALTFSTKGNPAGIACPLIDSTGDYTAASTRVEINQNGTVGFTVAAGVATAGVAGTTIVTDGKPHSIVVTRNNTALQLWVDGVSQGTATMGAAVYGAGDYVQLGNYITRFAFSVGGDVAGLTHFNGSLQHFVAWDNVALTTDQASLLGGALIGFRGDTPRNRIGHLLELAGLNASFVGGDSPATLGAARLGGSLLSELQRTATSEAGVIATDPFRTGISGIAASSLTFWGRYSQTDAAPVVLTDEAADTGPLALHYVADRFEVQWDDRLVVNECRVTGANGLEFTATDASSQTAYGIKSRSIDTDLDTLEQVRNYAEYIVLRYRYPLARLGRLTLKPQRDPAKQWPLTLGLDLLDAVTVVWHPLGAGAFSSIDCLVDGIEHQLNAASGEWTVTVAASPRDATLDDSEARWVLGTSTFDDETILYF